MICSETLPGTPNHTPEHLSHGPLSSLHEEFIYPFLTLWNQADHCDSKSQGIYKIKTVFLFLCDLVMYTLLHYCLSCAIITLFFFKVPSRLWFGLSSELCLKFLATLCLKWLNLHQCRILYVISFLCILSVTLLPQYHVVLILTILKTV